MRRAVGIAGERFFYSSPRWLWLPGERPLRWALGSAKAFLCLSQVGSRHQRKENTVLFWLKCSASRLHSVPHSLEGYEANRKSALCYRGCSWDHNFLLERRL